MKPALSHCMSRCISKMAHVELDMQGRHPEIVMANGKDSHYIHCKCNGQALVYLEATTGTTSPLLGHLKVDLRSTEGMFVHGNH